MTQHGAIYEVGLTLHLSYVLVESLPDLSKAPMRGQSTYLVRGGGCVFLSHDSSNLL